MNELAVRYENPPARVAQRVQLNASHTRMNYISAVSQIAMEIVSDAHRYTIRNLVNTIAEAERLKQSCATDLPPGFDSVYEQLTNQYLALTESILRQYSQRLMDEVERAANASGNFQLLMWLKEWLGLQ